jgi:hypothetical protein
MNIVIVSVLLSIAAVIVVPIGFVFGGLWGLLLAVFILTLIVAGLYVAEEKSLKAAMLLEQKVSQRRKEQAVPIKTSPRR